MLSEDSKKSADPVELFFFTNFNFTGITTDTIPVKEVEQSFREFCGNFIVPIEYIAEDIAKKCNLLV